MARPVLRRTLLLAGIAALVAVALPDTGTPVRLATFNIELFPDLDTAVLRVAEVMAETDADIFALQEIRNDFVLDLALMRASELAGRDWRSVLPQCNRGDWFTTAIVYDAARWQLVAAREYPGLDPGGDGQCRPREIPGMLAVFADGDARIAVLSVHLRAHPDGFLERRVQWRRALTIARAAERELGIPVALMGDMNSTGYNSGEPADEPAFIREITAAFGFELQTEGLACTEYWRPNARVDYRPSLLDHIVTRGSAEWSEPEVHGYCARLACATTPADAMDPDYFHVSDHCPVVLDGTLDAHAARRR